MIVMNMLGCCILTNILFENIEDLRGVCEYDINNRKFFIIHHHHNDCDEYAWLLYTELFSLSVQVA